MKLLIVNGSPRANTSNSKSMLNRWMFTDDYKKDTINAIDIYRGKEKINSMFGYDAYLIILPLYVDSVPASLKYVFELMYDKKSAFTDKKVYYIVHSGFPEACHSRACERYLEYFTSLMKMKYMGCGIFGGSESMSLSPPDAFYKGKIPALRSMTQSIKAGESFTKEDLSKLSDVEKLSAIRKLFTRLFKVKFYWDKYLKDNNAYEKRYDRPLA